MALFSCFDGCEGPIHIICWGDKFCINLITLLIGILGGTLKVLAQIFNEALRIQGEVVSLENQVEILQERFVRC